MLSKIKTMSTSPCNTISRRNVSIFGLFCFVTHSIISDINHHQLFPILLYTYVQSPPPPGPLLITRQGQNTILPASHLLWDSQEQNRVSYHRDIKEVKEKAYFSVLIILTF